MPSTALHRGRWLTRSSWPGRKSGPHLLGSVQAFALHSQAYVAPLKSHVFPGAEGATRPRRHQRGSARAELWGPGR